MWRNDDESKIRLLRILALGGACGVVLGLFALGYTAICILFRHSPRRSANRKKTWQKFHI